jgi:hypothetical protein
VDLGIPAAVVVLVLFGFGYAAWRWLLRRLRECEDRLNACEDRVQRAREEIAATPTPPIDLRNRREPP